MLYNLIKVKELLIQFQMEKIIGFEASLMVIKEYKQLKFKQKEEIIFQEQLLILHFQSMEIFEATMYQKNLVEQRMID
jgi:hypothetical protein